MVSYFLVLQQLAFSLQCYVFKYSHIDTHGSGSFIIADVQNSIMW